MFKKATWFLLVSLLFSMVGGAALAEGEFSYPMAFDGTLKYWVPLNSNVSASAATLNDTPFAQYLYEATGIKVEYLHPTVGSEAEAFNLILASGDMPDIIEADWLSTTYYPAGMDAAISNGLAEPLNNHPDWVPNYMATLAGNETWNKMAMTDKGQYPGFRFIRGDKGLQVYAGMVIRQDWLDKLGMEVPTTIDQWTEMLRAFRDELGATAPMITRNAIPDILDTNAFVGAYGVVNSNAGFYVQDGRVKYGRMEEGYKQALELLASWYEEGLLNQDFITDDSNTKSARVLNGEGGAFYGLTGSGIGVFMNSAAQAGNTEFNLVAAPYPVLNEGDYPEFGHNDNPLNNTIAVVNPKGQNLEAAIRFLDFGYGEAGTALFNYGKEGESFNWVDGYPTYTDAVLKPEGGISIGNAIARHARSSYGGPFVQGLPYIEQYLQLQIQRDALKAWGATNMMEHTMPAVSVSEADSAEYNKIIAEVNTFVSEYVSLAINGTYDLENFQTEYVDVLKDIGIERALEIQQKAYEAFLARGQ